MHNQILTNRSIMKSDRISKILSAYTAEGDKNNQQSFRLLSQKIKRKIGNQMSEHQVSKKVDIQNDNKSSQLQISVKDLLLHKNMIQKSQSKKSRYSNNCQTSNTEIIEKLNNTQNEIYKNYLAKRNGNGSKTYRDSSNQSCQLGDLDIRIKLNDKSSQSQHILLQTLMNKSHEKKSVEPRDSPDLCCTPQHLFNMLHQSVNCQSSLLVRSGSQGNVAHSSQVKQSKTLDNKDGKLSKIKSYLELAKTYRPSCDPYKLTLQGLQDMERIKKNQLVQVEKKKITSIIEIANKAQHKLQTFSDYLLQQEQLSSDLQSLILNEISPDDSIESIQSLE